jgi:hypothetical protein
MKTIEQMEVNIKKNWFPKHVATVTEYEKVTILDWREPGTNMYSVRYIFASNKLFISGDIGEAIFDLTWYATIQSFKDVDIGYLMGKLACSSRKEYDFVDQKARQELNEWRDERLEDMENDVDYRKEINDTHEEVESAISESSDTDYFSHAVFRVYHEVSTQYIDSEDFSMISDFGKQLNSVFPAYLLGIKMAIEQLESRPAVTVSEKMDVLLLSCTDEERTVLKEKLTGSE